MISEMQLTSIGIAREMSRPFDEGAALKITRRHGVETDRAYDTRVRQLRLRCDDAIRDVVVDGLVTPKLETALA